LLESKIVVLRDAMLVKIEELYIRMEVFLNVIGYLMFCHMFRWDLSENSIMSYYVTQTNSCTPAFKSLVILEAFHFQNFC
jgi:hypothetical protein